MAPNGLFARDEGNHKILYCGKPENAARIIEAESSPREAQPLVDQTLDAARQNLKAARAEAFVLPIENGNILLYGTCEDATLLDVAEGD